MTYSQYKFMDCDNELENIYSLCLVINNKEHYVDIDLNTNKVSCTNAKSIRLLQQKKSKDKFNEWLVLSDDSQ